MKCSNEKWKTLILKSKGLWCICIFFGMLLALHVIVQQTAERLVTRSTQPTWLMKITSARGREINKLETKAIDIQSSTYVPHDMHNKKRESRCPIHNNARKELQVDYSAFQFIEFYRNGNRWENRRKLNLTVKCPTLKIGKETKSSREKWNLQCKNDLDPFVSYTMTNDSADVIRLSFGDKCLKTYIESCCTGDYRIPNVVHYNWYKRDQLTFDAFASLIGVISFVRPCVIIFHGDKLPFGKYWDFVIQTFPNIVHSKWTFEKYIQGKVVKYKEHYGDIVRLEALLKFGGIYLDTDTILVKSVNALRNYSCVMSNQSNGVMPNSFIMAEQNSTFLKIWLNKYKTDYHNNSYEFNSMYYPADVRDRLPQLIHVELGTISRPWNMTGPAIYQTQHADYDWSHIYGIHLFRRIFRKVLNEKTIRFMKNIAGSVFRYVIYGYKGLCDV